MSKAKSVTATFELIKYDLTITRPARVPGKVTSSPTGIDCGTDCMETYLENTVVTLTATAGNYMNFTGWSGACTGTGTCTVTMSEAKTVWATFHRRNTVLYTLTVSKAGTGTGTVTSTPIGIGCGIDCTEQYANGTVVTLTAAPDSGSMFSGWSGACTGTGTCTVTMSAVRSVTATFSSNPTYTLTLVNKGTGSGLVVSSPAGISCGSDCTEAFNPGTVVKLTATAEAGSTFTGWSGACGGTGASCWVTMGKEQDS